VQKSIDGGGLKDGLAVKAEGICEIHQRFCELLPEDLLWAEDPVTKAKVRVAPGELRTRDVKVGNHIAISPGALPCFLERFEQVYGNVGKTETIISTAAAHHRLLWIHPFVDGNSRVARLMSHAVMLKALDTGAVWSVARGLARNVYGYRALLASCDQTGRNDLTGSSTLRRRLLPSPVSFSQSALTRWTSWRAWFSRIVCAPTFCCGPKRKSGSGTYLPSQETSLRRCSPWRAAARRG
jgi:hypothetical protein